MKTTKILESAYFHTGNSGMTFSILQNELTHGNDNKTLSYSLEVNHSSHGACSKFDMPIGSNDVCSYLIEALQRVQTHMNENNFTEEFSFAYGRQNNIEDYIKIKNGLKKEDITFDITFKNGDICSRTVGYNYIDDNGNVKFTEMLEIPKETFSGCSGD